MIDHVGINCADFARSATFYDHALGVLGYTRQMDMGVAVGYGVAGKPSFWIADMAAGEAGGPNREVHLAFAAKDAEAVQAFYRTALSLGAEPLHEPRLWPEYHEHYYGAFVRDPDGNNVEAVFHGGGPPEQAGGGPPEQAGGGPPEQAGGGPPEQAGGGPKE